MSSLLDTVITRTVAIENYIAICSLLDKPKDEPEIQLSGALSLRLSSSTDWSEERIFRHRNIVIQLYSIYEWFSEQALAHWVAQLPRNQKFVDLSIQLQNTYRYGISRTIREIGTGRYKHLELQDVLEKYFKSVRGDSSWDIVDEALVFHQLNLRRNEFVKLFGGAGLKNIWSSLENCKPIVEYQSETEPDRSLEQMIRDLVEYRNAARAIAESW